MTPGDLWHWIIGRPLKSQEAHSERISAPEGLAALSLDALTSVAYGPEAIALVLVGAGLSGMGSLLPITVAIVGLLVLLVLSYSQVIEAYPNGGGAYAVSRENLGSAASLVAAAALIVDYVLTVAVSAAAGIASLTSAFPALLPWSLPLSLLVVALITVLNLRGVGESARAFLLPTVVFIGGILATIVIGLTHARPVAVSHNPIAASPLEVLGVLLILKAFAAGCTALTGVEAIANGVPLFREPRIRRAKATMRLLGIALASMLLGLALLAQQYHLVPRDNVTLLSQVMTGAVGYSWLYYTTSIAVTMALGLAANTSFGSLPLLASVLARDHYLPHSFSIRGDRLVFETGIWVLAFAAALLLVSTDANTQSLIPLFAIGVFTGFTLSQAGMVRRWARRRPAGWRLRAGLNGLGAVATGLATLIFVYSKFGEGAWVVVVAIPLLIWMFRAVSRYYRVVGAELHSGAPDALPAVVARPRPLVVVPVTPDFNVLTARALGHALGLSDQVVAITVLFEDLDESRKAVTEQDLQERWKAWGVPVRLVVLHSQYHSVVRPLLRFIGSLNRREGERILVLVPEIVPRRWWQRVFHNGLGRVLTAALQHRTDVVVGIVSFHPWAWDVRPAARDKERGPSSS